MLKSLSSSGDEQQTLHADYDESEEYKFDHKRRGLALVIINEKFRGHAPREGSQIDASRLSDTFSLLGFEVRLVKDCTLEELRCILKGIAEEDHTDADCFVLAISSHGDEIIQKLPKDKKQVRQDVVFCTDFFMQTRDLVFAFSDSQCPTLTGKPRLFFIQACRGSQLDPGQDMEVFQSTLDEVDGFPDAKVIVSPAPLFKDCLIMYATPPGYFAFRRPKDGSWFIQALCSVLENCDGTKTILQLLTRVTQKVTQEFMSRTPLNYETDCKKQTPCLYSMLTKDLLLKAAHQSGQILVWS
ncbi:caspase-3-like isoform X2 [Pomacea canaliculata]|nr:caspase-3-like isoform X2 [Pomacea canaliculata]